MQRQATANVNEHARRRQIVQEFRHIVLHAESDDDASSRFAAWSTTWEELGEGDYVAYVTKQWWCDEWRQLLLACRRNEVARFHCNTTNNAELWHNQMKNTWLGGVRRRDFVDVLRELTGLPSEPSSLNKCMIGRAIERCALIRRRVEDRPKLRHPTRMLQNLKTLVRTVHPDILVRQAGLRNDLGEYEVNGSLAYRTDPEEDGVSVTALLPRWSSPPQPGVAWKDFFEVAHGRKVPDKNIVDVTLERAIDIVYARSNSARMQVQQQQRVAAEAQAEVRRSAADDGGGVSSLGELVRQPTRVTPDTVADALIREAKRAGLPSTLPQCYAALKARRTKGESVKRAFDSLVPGVWESLQQLLLIRSQPPANGADVKVLAAYAMNVNRAVRNVIMAGQPVLYPDDFGGPARVPNVGYVYAAVVGVPAAAVVDECERVFTRRSTVSKMFDRALPHGYLAALAEAEPISVKLRAAGLGDEIVYLMYIDQENTDLGSPRTLYRARQLGTRHGDANVAEFVCSSSMKEFGTVHRSLAESTTLDVRILAIMPKVQHSAASDASSFDQVSITEAALAALMTGSFAPCLNNSPAGQDERFWDAAEGEESGLDLACDAVRSKYAEEYLRGHSIDEIPHPWLTRTLRPIERLLQSKGYVNFDGKTIVQCDVVTPGRPPAFSWWTVHMAWTSPNALPARKYNVALWAGKCDCRQRVFGLCVHILMMRIVHTKLGRPIVWHDNEVALYLPPKEESEVFVHDTCGVNSGAVATPVTPGASTNAVGDAQADEVAEAFLNEQIRLCELALVSLRAHAAGGQPPHIWRTTSSATYELAQSLGRHKLYGVWLKSLGVLTPTWDGRGGRGRQERSATSKTEVAHRLASDGPLQEPRFVLPLQPTIPARAAKAPASGDSETIEVKSNEHPDAPNYGCVVLAESSHALLAGHALTEGVKDEDGEAVRDDASVLSLSANIEYTVRDELAYETATASPPRKRIRRRRLRQSAMPQ